MPETPAPEEANAPVTWWEGMRALLDQHQHAVVTIALISTLTLVAAALVLPVIVVKMRPDYFMPERDLDRSFAQRHPVLRLVGLVLKNALGLLLLLSGVAMLVLPGQGILTILMGLMLTDLPGKKRMELWLVRRPPVLKALNWMRSRRGKPPFMLPPASKAVT